MKDLRDPKFWASIFAWMVPITISIGIISSKIYCWNIIETSTFIGALAGPFSGLAGFLYVYATFKLQREQMNSQASQFHIDQTNQMFFRLFNSFIKIRDSVHYFGPKDFIKLARFSEDQREFTYGEKSFMMFRQFIMYWALSPKGWKSLTKEIFDNRGNDYEFVPFRDSFKFENASKYELRFILKAVIDEASFGSYFRSIENLISYCIANNTPSFLKVIEANQGKDERVILYYYFGLLGDSNTISFITQNKYLQTVSKKHLIVEGHSNILYK